MRLDARVAGHELMGDPDQARPTSYLMSLSLPSAAGSDTEIDWASFT
jgi:hypothetical protein